MSNAPSREEALFTDALAQPPAERVAGYLRPAAAAGKLTRFGREVLLAGIEKQLAALPPP